MSTQEVQELIEYSDIFKKYLIKKINEIQAQLGMCLLKGKENQAYIAIETLKSVIEGLDKTAISYSEYLNVIEKKKVKKKK